MKKIESFGKNVIVVFFVCMMLYLTVSSLFVSADIALDGMEKTTFHGKIWPVTLLFAAMVVAVIYRFREKIENADSHRLMRVLLVYDFLLCIFWMVVANTKEGADQAQVLYAAKQFCIGDYRKLAADQYMGMFPYQLPLALLYEPFYKLFGDVTPFLWQLVNTFLICLCQYFIYKIIREVCENKMIVNIAVLLQFLNFPLILYVSFIYGTVIGMTFALAAIYFGIRVIQGESHGWRNGMLSAVFLAMACLLRNNCLIWAIAAFIVAGIAAVAKKNIRLLLYIPLVLAVFIGARTAVYKCYELRSGMEVDKGMPSSLFIAMGLAENEERANGWYNGYNWDTYLELGCDREKAVAFADNAIQDQLDKFAKDPVYALGFFREKIDSTWLNPDFQGLWNNHHHGQAIACAPVIYNLYTGELHTVAEFLLGNIQFMIYAGALICFLAYRKKMNLYQCIFALIFVGGFLFHLFWETKAQYVIVYYVLLFPYAGAGIHYLIKKIGMCKKRKEEKPAS